MKNEKTAKKPMPKTAKIIIISVIALIIIAFVFGLIYLKPQTLIKKLDIDQSSIDKIVMTAYYPDPNITERGVLGCEGKILTDKIEIEGVFNFIKKPKTLLCSNLKQELMVGIDFPTRLYLAFYSKNEFVKSIEIADDFHLLYINDEIRSVSTEGELVKILSSKTRYFPDYTAFVTKQFPDNKALKKEMESIDEIRKVNS